MRALAAFPLAARLQIAAAIRAVRRGPFGGVMRLDDLPAAYAHRVYPLARKRDLDDLSAPALGMAPVPRLKTDKTQCVPVPRSDYELSKQLMSVHCSQIETTMRQVAGNTAAQVPVLEHKLSDLATAAPSLTPEEVKLMWVTIPPRMPFTP
jgi:hypothetical protein